MVPRLPPPCAGPRSSAGACLRPALEGRPDAARAARAGSAVSLAKRAPDDRQLDLPPLSKNGQSRSRHRADHRLVAAESAWARASHLRGRKARSPPFPQADGRLLGARRRGVQRAAAASDRALRERAAEELVPGAPLFFCTAMTLGGYA